MKKLQNGIYSFFGIVSYMAQLNLQWLFFTSLGGVILGIGPATAITVRFLHDYRENKSEYSFTAFWQAYKQNFKKFTLVGFLYTAFLVLLIVNLRIIIVLVSTSWIAPAYTFFAILLSYLSLMSFLTYAKAEDVSFQKCLKVTLFMVFRYPLQTLSLLTTVYLFSLLFGSKSSLALIFGASTILFFAEFFHSQMIQKTKDLQGGKSQQDEPVEMDQAL
jgi:uncharacterized membrane protein YesL